MINKRLFTTRNAPAPTLRVIAISGNSFTVGNPQGTFVGNVQNTTSGSTITFASLSVANSLQLAKVGGIWQIQVGSAAPGSPSTLTFNLVETMAGATNTPRTTTGFSVGEVAATDVLKLALGIAANSLPIAA